MCGLDRALDVGLKILETDRHLKNLRLCFAGNMLGRNAGYIPTQGEIVAQRFAVEGFSVTCVSARINRLARLVEIIATVLKNRRKFDVVILDVYSGLNLIMAETVGRLCGFLELPLIMVLHGGNLPEVAGQKPLKMKRILERADLLAAPSRFLADKLGVLGFEIRVIPNLLEIKSYEYRERRRLQPNLLWMRSFHPVYNPQMAVDTLAELKKKFPAATLTMAGVDKGLEEETKKRAARLGLTGAVRFPGFLDAAKKREEFARADIFINTNRVDNMPVSVVEAMAFGLPVVATGVGGLPYLLSHGENGLLVPSEDAKAMAREIENLLENPASAKKLSAGGRRLAEQSAWENVRPKWEELFAEAVSGRSPAKASTPLIERKLTIDKT